MPESPEQATDRYLRSGEHDAHFRAWPGNDFLARIHAGDAALRSALISAVHSRTVHIAFPETVANIDVVAFTRGKVAPMVRGLFPASEQASVLDLLERSVILLTPATIDAHLQNTQLLATAWDLANLYLGGLGAELLAEDAPPLLGLSEETSCYLSATSFDAPGRFEDFVVHEAAHIFHNCKRETIGLRETRTRAWLLEIDYGKRETFAYACEAYSRLQALGDGPRERQRLLAEHEQGSMPPDERVDAVEYVEILREAVAVRNGWKRILQRCSPPRVARRALLGAA
ncbi:MAG: hypothetical protein AW11_03855 [Candidatus Accumulibacter regalis]|uniref:Uncharacterized protein n=1 Tax=Accumulibacter regalis TaxID=522306 RepID=A0A011PA74_ACCRE|nr:MAG: hypothetical protein AW11_03855 [Candidatus Accumulibacter regalis]